MKTIESNFEKYKTTFNLIRREGNVAIFTRTGEGFPLSYEVVEILSHNGMRYGDNWVDAKEFLPSNEQWGQKGFSYVHLEDAEARFLKMVEREKNPLTKEKPVDVSAMACHVSSIPPGTDLTNVAEENSRAVEELLATIKNP